MLFGGKKERSTEKQIGKHISKVGEVLANLHQAVNDYCEGCVDFDTRAQDVERGETEADQIRRKVEQQLYDGAFMPVQRADYLRMVEAVDKVANQAESVAQFLLLTRPALEPDVIDGLKDIMNATIRCYEYITRMYEKFEEGKLVVEMAHKVEEEESRVDKIFAAVVRGLFASEIDLARKLHAKMLLDRSAAISNRIEDASDYFIILVAKRPM